MSIPERPLNRVVIGQWIADGFLSSHRAPFWPRLAHAQAGVLFDTDTASQSAPLAPLITLSPQLNPEARIKS